MTTYEKLAKEAIQNFEKMTGKMAALANGNGNYSQHWPDEETVFASLRSFTTKNRELKKALSELQDEKKTFVI